MMHRSFILKISLFVFFFNILHHVLHAKKETSTKAIENFLELEVSNAVSVVLRKAQKNEKLEASIELEGIDASRLVIKNKGDGILSIALKKELELFSRTRKQKATVRLPYIRIDKIRLKNASRLSMEDANDEIVSKKMEIIVENASEIHLRKISCDELKVVAKNASKLKIDSGKSITTSITSKSASSVDLQGLHIRDAEVDASSASNVNLGSIEKLKAQISSLAKVSYQGQPKISEIQVASAGDLNKV